MGETFRPDKVPAHLNPNNDPEREKVLLKIQATALEENSKMRDRLMETNLLLSGIYDFDNIIAECECVRAKVLAWDFSEKDAEDFDLRMQTMITHIKATLSEEIEEHRKLE